MTTADYVAAKLAPLAIPLAYRHKKDAAAPYLTYYIGDTRITAADCYPGGGVSCTIEDDATVELHTVSKDAVTEAAITAAFASDGLSLTIHEDYDYYEDVYVVTFSFTRVHKIKFT